MPWYYSASSLVAASCLQTGLTLGTTSNMLASNVLVVTVLFVIHERPLKHLQYHHISPITSSPLPTPDHTTNNDRERVVRFRYVGCRRYCNLARGEDTPRSLNLVVTVAKVIDCLLS